MKAAPRILVVDDEPDAREFLRDVLEDQGFEVETAASAAEGLANARTERPDLVCLDVLMPEETGFSLYQKLRTDARLCDVPIVITSGMSFARELKQISYRDLPDGRVLPEPDGVVEKPVDVEDLLRVVRQVLR